MTPEQSKLVEARAREICKEAGFDPDWVTPISHSMLWTFYTSDAARELGVGKEDGE